jgi:hypothetical protein
MSFSPFPQFGNMMAPPWCGFSPVLRGVRDVEFELDLPPVTIAGGTVGGVYSRGNQLPVDADADFLVREIQFVIVGASGSAPLPSDLRVRIKDGDGRLMTSDFVPILDINGPLVPPWPLRRGAVLIIDFLNLQAAAESSTTVWMLLKGWKRKLCPDDPLEIASPYTPMYSRYLQPDGVNDLEEFEYPFTFTSGLGDILKTPLQTDNDADFLWRGITGDWNTANNDVQAVGDVALTFYDVDGVPILQRPLQVPWGSTYAGELRESVIGNGGGRPAPFFPEIFIPRGGVVQLDLSFGSAQTVRFSLRGLKVYGRCNL